MQPLVLQAYSATFGVTLSLYTEKMSKKYSIPDDRPRVSELIKFHELSIKKQLEKYLPLDEIKNVKDFKEDPTLLHKLREATGKKKGIMIAYSLSIVSIL